MYVPLKNKNGRTIYYNRVETFENQPCIWKVPSLFVCAAKSIMVYHCLSKISLVDDRILHGVANSPNNCVNFIISIFSDNSLYKYANDNNYNFCNFFKWWKSVKNNDFDSVYIRCVDEREPMSPNCTWMHCNCERWLQTPRSRSVRRKLNF